jgi:ATP-dependent helicase/nuclease subunit A
MPLDRAPTEQLVREVLERMAALELLTPAQREAVEPEPIIRFFAGELGQRLLKARSVRREVPFTYALPAEEAYPGGAPLAAPESVIVQGVIDCLMEDEIGLVLIDFKTDAIRESSADALRERYRVQLELYARAVEHIWRRPVAGKYAVYLESGLAVEV